MCPNPRDQCTGLAGHRVERRPSVPVATLHSSYQSIPGQVGRACYGACANFHELETIEYIAGVEVSSFHRCLKVLRSVRLATVKYAAFSQPGHISTIRRAVHNLWTKWIPELGLDAADAPDFESYGSEFDARTGMGGFEI
jgi:AraC family transcriptional regulator